MYCRHCGKQISDDAAFCQYCGKQLSVSVPKPPTKGLKGWGYLTIVYHFRKGEAGWVVQDTYPAPIAQQKFWNDFAPLYNEMVKILTENAADGWQPVGEHGPSCIELESYKSAEGNSAAVDAINAVQSLGASLLFNKSWKFTVKTITCRWRCPIEEGTREEFMHMWLNPKTNDWEQWEIDANTNKWILVKLEEDDK